MDNLIGKTLDGLYRLDELIGVGGMANVYRAQDLKHDRVVAVKVLREEFMDNTDLVRRFKNESKAISILNHPNIVKVYDVSVTDQLQYIVMEYINGITLKEYLRQRGEPLTWKEVVHFTSQVLGALEHAHANGVVHRDVKPQNIMLLADGSVKMMDFGIARLSRSECHTINEKAIGSVHYISPEQAKGDVTDAKADIYSVGVMMYEMLTGTLPFEADSPVSVAIKQISDTARPIRELNPAVPEALEEITNRAMAKDPATRYPTAGDMLADLEEFKKNPSIRFEYKYLTENSPMRYIDKVVSQTKKTNETQKAAQTQSRTAPKKAAPKKKKRRQRSLVIPVMLGMALAFALGSAFLCYNIFANSNNMLFSEKPNVELENFIGMTQSEVEQNATYKENFNFEWETEYNPSYEAGVIYEQSPRAPKEVKQGQTVVLKVSLGIQMIEVPDVANLTRDSAQQTLRDAGLTVTVRPDRESSAAENTVVRTDPAAGQQVAQGDTVVLYVAQAAIQTETEVPNLMNLSSGDVVTALKNAKLVSGQVTEEYSTSVPAGLVISQSVAPGEKVRVHSRINYVVSLGSPPVTLSLSYDDSTLEVGKTTVFTATVGYADAKDVVWSVGGVTGSGATFSVTWKEAGTYTLKASVAGTPAELTFEVKKARCPVCGSTEHTKHPSSSSSSSGASSSSTASSAPTAGSGTPNKEDED